MSEELELSEAETLALLAECGELDEQGAARLSEIRSSENIDQTRVEELTSDMRSIPAMPMAKISEHGRQRILHDILASDSTSDSTSTPWWQWAVAAAAVLIISFLAFRTPSSTTPEEVRTTGSAVAKGSQSPLTESLDTVETIKSITASPSPSDIFDSSAWDKRVGSVESKVFQGFSRTRPMVDQSAGRLRRQDALRRRIEQLKSNSVFEG